MTQKFLASSVGVLLLSLLCSPVRVPAQITSTYKYFRVGSAADVTTPTQGGFALMGGGEDLDEAFRWMCQRSGGGDFLILRARGDDDYNPYVRDLCHENSVATLVLPDRTSAMDPAVAQWIAKAEAIFIAGGDQANYINNWMGTPVQDGINAAIKRGVPVGGTSAGLAVLGEYVYSAQNDAEDGPDLTSKASLADPFFQQIVFAHRFVDIPPLVDTIMDTHFVARDRMGRLLTMMARINAMEPERGVKGIGIDQRAAVLMDSDGKATIVGKGSAYFMLAKTKASVMKQGVPLSFGPVSAVKVKPGQKFDVAAWKGDEASYTYNVEAGMVRSTAKGEEKY